MQPPIRLPPSSSRLIFALPSVPHGKEAALAWVFGLRLVSGGWLFLSRRGVRPGSGQHAGGSGHGE